ncbi:MAG: OmpA family protein [Saprospiraceae bacterium]|nr:OmpA family protein [Saprospiraceae bacterium]
MTGLVAILIIVLIAVIVVQIGRLSEIAAKIRGEEEVEERSNNKTAVYLLLFLVAFLAFCFISGWMYKDRMLGYGPHSAASEHGSDLDGLFNITLFWTGIVFVITHIALFWFSYKYRAQKNRKAYFFPHSTRLEIIWTVVPTFVLVYLVVSGLRIWNDVMFDVDPEDDYIEIEATGYQFAWDLRYPGPDGKLGTKDFRKIDLATNPLGQDWTDPKNIDDFQPTEIVLPKGKKVRVRINSKDVLHNFYLPHFRVKMDAVPGLPTYFVFTPSKTTEEYGQQLRDYPEYQELADPTDPESAQRWEEFEFELACAELCGKGHYSMRRLVKIVEPAEYEQWLAEQSSYYMSNIRNTENDPFKGQLLDIEILERDRELTSEFKTAIDAEESSAVIRLKNVFFETGSAELKDDSKYELNKLASLINESEGISVKITGHTDNTGDNDANIVLSKDRANAVVNYLSDKGVSGLTAQGYGSSQPVDSNDTEEGRKNNRRTEIIITK